MGAGEFVRPRVYFLTLGCPKNDADSRSLMRQLESRGGSLVEDAADATHIVINTCGFIQEAKEESIEAILSACAQFPGKQVLVMGCLVERYREQLKRGVPEVAGWFGAAGGEVDREMAHALLATEAENSYRGAAARITRTAHAYLKISDGCDEGCTFCAIPGFKGRYRSVPIAQILQEAEVCLADGARELILVGQDTTRWNCDGLDLQGLIELLGSDNRVRWIRVMYLQPTRVERAFLEFMAAHSKLCSYLDIPFQHSHPEVLRRMGRLGSGASYLSLVRLAREIMPHVSMRSTFIVGFPGENEAAFADLLDFAKKARFDYAGGFAYSAEEGTAAAGFAPVVPREVAMERLHRLNRLILEVAEHEHRALVGTELDVVVDTVEEGEETVTVGRTQGQAPDVDGVTYLEGQRPEGLVLGDVVRARITAVVGYDLIGEFCAP
jgi:ribosomal protein S12 methylthiotransferase